MGNTEVAPPEIRVHPPLSPVPCPLFSDLSPAPRAHLRFMDRTESGRLGTAGHLGAVAYRADGGFL